MLKKVRQHFISVHVRKKREKEIFTIYFFKTVLLCPSSQVLGFQIKVNRFQGPDQPAGLILMGETAHQLLYSLIFFPVSLSPLLHTAITPAKTGSLVRNKKLPRFHKSSPISFVRRHTHTENWL